MSSVRSFERAAVGNGRQSPLGALPSHYPDYIDKDMTLAEEIDKQHQGQRPPVTRVRNIPASDAVDFSGKTQYNDFRDDLVHDGVAVIKGVLSPEKCAQLCDRMHEYLESFGLGYKRDDPSTIVEECLPVINEKGMMQHYGVCHEDFAWAVRADPNVKRAWEIVYGTKDLLVSFDQVNITFPNRKDLPENKPWPHQDQDPDTRGFRCLQGFVNFLPAGENEGGLVAMKGAHRVSDEFHDVFAKDERLWGWTNEVYSYKDSGLDWLRARGFEFSKINLGPGDLVLWDSRVPHYNQSPREGARMRMGAYVCYAPVATANEDDLQRKKEAFENYRGTSHWPQALQVFWRPCTRRDGTPCPIAEKKKTPTFLPKLDAEALKLTGIPYLTSVGA